LVLHKGIPQGSPIAPLLSNLYLHHLDGALLDENLRLIRFADDFLILCKSQNRAEQALELTDNVLRQLRLTLNSRKTHIVHFDQGFRFLGVQFIRSLAFKVDAKEADLPGLLPVASEVSISASTAEPIAEPLSIMQQAFVEANLNPDDFKVADEPIEDFVSPEADDNLPADHDPLLRTLYILQHGQVLGKESERLVVRQAQTIVREIPAIKVDQIMVFGNAQITTQAMQFCLSERIPIYLLSGQGHYYGVIDSFNTEPVLLQREQFLRASDPAFCLKLATALVHGKIANSRLMLQRLARRHNVSALSTAAATLKNALTNLSRASSLDELRGFEGCSANVYFQALSATLDRSWGFSHRVRQPPTDGINAMLSYGYTLLFYNINFPISFRIVP
jgi:CRISPR-associated protein Cas1